MTTTAAPASSRARLMHFAAAVSHLPGFRRLRAADGRHRLDLWVITETEDLDVHEQIFMLEVEMLAGLEDADLDIRVHPRAAAFEASLPGSEIIFERRP